MCIHKYSINCLTIIPLTHPTLTHMTMGSIRPMQSTFFVHADLKDYFLSGTPTQIIDDVKGCFDGCEKALVKDALWLLLKNQYISDAFHKGRL